MNNDLHDAVETVILATADVIRTARNDPPATEPSPRLTAALECLDGALKQLRPHRESALARAAGVSCVASATRALVASAARN